MEVELTSKVDDDTWTWRAAGAKQPKGRLDAKLLYDGAKLGDIVRAEVEDDIEGIAVLAVLPPKEKRSEPERLEILAPPERAARPVSAPATAERGQRPPAKAKDRARGDRPDRSA